MALLLCVGIAAAQLAANANTTTQYNEGQIGVCHATGSESNPYVYIEPNAASAHLENHPNDYPADGPEDCAVASGGGTTAAPTPGTTTEPPTTTPGTTAVTTPATTIAPPATTPGTTAVTTTPGTTAAPTTGGTTAKKPVVDISLGHVCTIEPGLEKVIVTNNGENEQTGKVDGGAFDSGKKFTLEPGESFTTEVKVSQGTAVARVVVLGEVVTEIKIRQNFCDGATTTPREDAPADTATVDGSGDPTGDSTLDGGTEPGKADGNVEPSATPTGSDGADGGQVAQAPEGASEQGSGGEVGAEASDDATLSDPPAGDVETGSAPNGTGVLPDTGGASLLAPLAAALLGVGIVALSIIRRR